MKIACKVTDTFTNQVVTNKVYTQSEIGNWGVYHRGILEMFLKTYQQMPGAELIIKVLAKNLHYRYVIVPDDYFCQEV